MRAYAAEYLKNNKEKLRAAAAAYYVAHREERIRYTLEFTKKKLKEDLAFKIKHYLRSRIRLAIKGGVKSGSIIKAIGAPIDEVRRHLERMFTSRMTWENYGKYWQIDHIRPLSSFDLTDEAQFNEACHYLNMRPLEKQRNLKKGATREFLL